MKMKKAFMVIIVLAVAAASVYFFLLNHDSGESKYMFGKIKRGNIENLISSSGTLKPVSIVEVGTQVSGVINKIYVDFNDVVKRGQLLAVLDTTFLEAAVRDSRASLSRAEAQLNESKSKHERNKKLHEKEFISELEFIMSETAVATALASVQSAKSSLQRSETNLEYAFIRSPIAGVVIHRSIEEGQTVAASFSTPTLFQIAEDLKKIEILVDVDESDIGQIFEGMEVRFSVQAYYEKSFEGVVRQIRLQPQTIQNVVNYTVVVNANNNDGKLLPGMTATVDFYVEKKEDVLLIPNAAFSFSPPEEFVTEYREKMRARMDSLRNSSDGQSMRERSGGGFGGEGGRRGNMGSVWMIDENGALTMKRVMKSTTNGKFTQIGNEMMFEEGMEVITGIEESDETTNANQPMTRMPPGLGGRRF